MSDMSHEVGPSRVDELDPITFEVLKNAFSSIVDEMGALVQAAAFSLVVSEGRDYCGAICTANGDLVASGSTDLPGHLGTLPFTVKGTLAWLDDEGQLDFAPGDCVIMNDAFIGGTHNNDVRVVMPVFYEDEVVAFVQNSTHWPDIGGHVPGTFHPTARSIHAEGLVITPVRLVRQGEIDRDLLRLLLRNVRTPEVAYGDLLAQVGACRLGAARLQALMERYGVNLILREMDALMTYSEALLRAEFAALPDGTYTWTSYIDQDPGDESDDEIPIVLELTIDRDRATYDFSHSHRQAKGAINGPPAICISAAILTTKAIFPHIPMNQGVFRAIEFVLPPGLVVSAEYPAAICGMGATGIPAVANAVLGCFMQIAPARAMAGTCGLVNVVFGGVDERADQPREYVAYLWLEGGWGARSSARDNHTAMTISASTATNQPIELHERVFPMMYESYQYKQDSAGAGMHRGGLGVEKAWHITSGDGVLSVLGDRAKSGPWGYDGGLAARANSFVYAAGSEEEEDIGMFRAGMRIRANRRIELFHAGGGGFGSPLDRPSEWVLEDVKDEFVSLEAARSVYGVVIEVIDPEVSDYRVDDEATRALRKDMERAGRN